MAMLLQLSLCIASVIQLTSSQPTVRCNDRVDLSGLETSVSQLTIAVSQIQTAVSQLVTDVTQMWAEMRTISQQQNNATEQLATVMSQLERDVAELKAVNGHKDTTGKMICDGHGKPQ